ncbi:type IV pilus biogenesis/stability protein PilW [Methylomonas sp. AM2-LC]|uniref:type IV pilus biogenesis/stability protein PilW n=1 Tax=Methylomonas sp. AM2-LC TaxID=3153301 RepID=UPI00326365C7
MQIRLATQVVYFLSLSLLTCACGLIPNMSGDSKSNAEKAQIYLEMGINYLEFDKLDIAKEKLDLALRYDSSNPNIYNALGSFYEHIKDYANAEMSYDSALSKGPDNFVVEANVGRYYCERGNFEKGISLTQEAIEQPMNNRQWYAYTNKGVCFEKQNNFAKAEEFFRLALKLQPEFAPALLEMQKISYENRQYMSARAFLERYLSVSQHTPQSLWIAFQTERALGNSKAAEDYANQYLETFPAAKESDQIRTLLGK